MITMSSLDDSVAFFLEQEGLDFGLDALYTKYASLGLLKVDVFGDPWTLKTLIPWIVSNMKQDEKARFLYGKQLPPYAARLVLDAADVKTTLSLILSIKAIADLERSNPLVFWRSVFERNFPQYVSIMEEHPLGDVWKKMCIWLHWAHTRIFEILSKNGKIDIERATSGGIDITQLKWMRVRTKTEDFVKKAKFLHGRLCTLTSLAVNLLPKNATDEEKQEAFISDATREKLAPNQGKWSYGNIPDGEEAFYALSFWSDGQSNLEETLEILSTTPKLQKDTRIFLGCALCGTDLSDTKLRCTGCKQEFCGQMCGKQHMKETHII